jgi:catechol 2,3-dioxygenase-like lactoylglutathione lyase family enzyme
MRPTHVIANLHVRDIAKAKGFYIDYLGLSSQGLDLGWVVRLATPDGKAVVQLVTRDATAAENAVLSVAVGDQVDRAYKEAVERGFQIVHRLTTEPWGLRRFFVRAPDGNVLNINSHSDAH